MSVLEKAPDRIVVQHEAYLTPEGWKGQAVEINKDRFTYHILFTTKETFEDEPDAHLAVIRWAKMGEVETQRARSVID